ncbi:hypothetical protein B0A49_13418 [Cryomyces minteri]|uniref:Uncharacterized protein n=1 Tax=Cryomyces minteri TaxID=331657 RepID=A0A4V5NAN9_9PEZI|nr:hypothetical protein B0A49_13418 [Cryomyces minteri]
MSGGRQPKRQKMSPETEAAGEATVAIVPKKERSKRPKSSPGTKEPEEEGLYVLIMDGVSLVKVSIACSRCITGHRTKTLMGSEHPPVSRTNEQSLDASKVPVLRVPSYQQPTQPRNLASGPAPETQNCCSAEKSKKNKGPKPNQALNFWFDEHLWQKHVIEHIPMPNPHPNGCLLCGINEFPATSGTNTPDTNIGQGPTFAVNMRRPLAVPVQTLPSETLRADAVDPTMGQNPALVMNGAQPEQNGFMAPQWPLRQSGQWSGSCCGSTLTGSHASQSVANDYNFSLAGVQPQAHVQPFIEQHALMRPQTNVATFAEQPAFNILQQDTFDFSTPTTAAQPQFVLPSPPSGAHPQQCCPNPRGEILHRDGNCKCDSTDTCFCPGCWTHRMNAPNVNEAQWVNWIQEYDQLCDQQRDQSNTGSQDPRSESENPSTLTNSDSDSEYADLNTYIQGLSATAANTQPIPGTDHGGGPPWPGLYAHGPDQLLYPAEASSAYGNGYL